MQDSDKAPLLKVSPVKTVKAKKAKVPTMRNHWFNHVAKTRKKLQRGNKDKVTHREAMRQASTSWGPIKEKLKRKQDRALKKANKAKSLIKKKA